MKKLLKPLAIITLINCLIGWIATSGVDAEEKMIKEETERANALLDDPDWSYILDNVDNWAETINRDPDGFWTP